MINLFIKYLNISAIKTPHKTPRNNCKNNILKISKGVIPPAIIFITIIVIIYAKGSLLPLSTSNMDAVLSFRFKCLSRSIENTLAASVDEITAPISILFIHENLRI